MSRAKVISLVVVLAVALGTGAFFLASSPERVFSGEDLAREFPGTLVAGQNADGRPFEALFLPDGEIELRVQDGFPSRKKGVTAQGPAIHGGAWRIDGDHMCIIWSLTLAMPEICYRLTFDGDQFRAYRGETIDSYFRVVVEGTASG